MSAPEATGASSLPVIVIRPEPAIATTVATAQEMGLNARACPLFTVHPVPWNPPDITDFDAILMGSANAIRHGGPFPPDWFKRPVYAVGKKTARAAQNAGFTVIATGNTCLQDVVDQQLAPNHRRLVRLAGEKRVALRPPSGTTIEEQILYAVKPLEMGPNLINPLQNDALVLLHSAVAARHFARECEAHHLNKGHIALACLAPRILQAAGKGWARAEASSLPQDKMLLALAQKMCQNYHINRWSIDKR